MGEKGKKGRGGKQCIHISFQKLWQTHYPYVVEIPTDFFDVDRVVKCQPATTHETAVRLRVLQKHSQKSRVTMTHLHCTGTSTTHACLTNGNCYYYTAWCPSHFVKCQKNQCSIAFSAAVTKCL